jgi:hypothetical protein
MTRCGSVSDETSPRSIARSTICASSGFVYYKRWAQNRQIPVLRLTPIR